MIDPSMGRHISLAGLQHYEILREKTNGKWMNKKEIIDITGLRNGWWINAIIEDWKKAGLVEFEKKDRTIYYRSNGVSSIKDLTDRGFYVSGYGRRMKRND